MWKNTMFVVVTLSFFLDNSIQFWNDLQLSIDPLIQSVHSRLQLLTVSAVTNDESWAQYVARREQLRREIDGDIMDFQRYDVAWPGDG